MNFLIEKHVRSSPFAKNLMVYDGLNNKYFLLKGGGRQVWELIENGFSFSEITENLKKEFSNVPEDFEMEVRQFLKAMIDNKLVRRV